MGTIRTGYYGNSNALCVDAASFITIRTRAAIEMRGVATLVLSGGRSPIGLYNILCAHPYFEEMNWERTHIFWGDERFVPRDHDDSNYKMAYETLISKVPLPPENVHNIPVNLSTPQEAAAEYEKEIRSFFKENNLESFDVVLLGIGKDGHTASLFPDDEAMGEKER